MEFLSNSRIIYRVVSIAEEYEPNRHRSRESPTNAPIGFLQSANGLPMKDMTRNLNHHMNQAFRPITEDTNVQE